MEVFGIKVDSIAVVVATFLGPIFAVLATRYLDDRTAMRKRQRAVFDTLMLTRRAALSPEHVRALNQIELEFSNDKEVMRAFHNYFDNLNEPFPDQTQTALVERFLGRRRRIFAELVRLIGERQNFKLDRLDLVEGGYHPIGWINDETLTKENIQLLNAILQGKRPLWIVGGSLGVGGPLPLSSLSAGGSAGPVPSQPPGHPNPFPPPPE